MVFGRTTWGFGREEDGPHLEGSSDADLLLGPHHFLREATWSSASKRTLWGEVPGGGWRVPLLLFHQ